MTDKIDKHDSEEEIKEELDSEEDEIKEEDASEIDKEGDSEEDLDEEIPEEDGLDQIEDQEDVDLEEKTGLDKKKKIVLSSILILTMIFGGTFYYLNSLLKSPAIYKGVKVEGIELGEKTREEALKTLKDKKEVELDKSKMELNYGDKKYDIQLRDLDFKYDYNKAVDEAYKQARQGKNFDRLKKIYKLRKEPIDIDLTSTFDKAKAEEVIGPIKEEINKDKVEASYKFNGGDPIITDEVIGKKINEEKLTELINNNIYELKPIEIPVDDVKPVKTKEALQRINGVIGEFSTSFPNSTAGRKENIRISAEAVSNRGVIMPGETVSFNQLTGDRSRANGYKEAVVIEEGNYTDGVGGGVCQTSTTLYNALLRADLTIVARGPHSIPARYVPFGQDAAVAYDYLDLKFKNDFDFPIYIRSIYSGSSLTFKVYGDKNVKNYGVKIDSETVEVVGFQTETVNDGQLAKGVKELVQSGRQGYKVNTYKSIIRDGKAQDRKLITKDYYRPKNAVYRVGTKEVSQPKEESESSESE